MALGKPERKLASEEIFSPLRLFSQNHDSLLTTNFSGIIISPTCAVLLRTEK